MVISNPALLPCVQTGYRITESSDNNVYGSSTWFTSIETIYPYINVITKNMKVVIDQLSLIVTYSLSKLAFLLPRVIFKR